MSFKRPGSHSKGAFGVTYSSRQDRQQQQQPARDAAAADEPGGSYARSRSGQLPIARVRRELLYLVETHATVILVGETGCGKTTQVPQYLHEAGWTSQGYQVVCTQPRRVAAITVAEQVASQMGVALGELVGYGVRFDSAQSQSSTRIKFVTDGVLLREMMDDPLLTRYSVVMVDEAHERSLATDTLLGLLKKVQKRRPDLRLIVSSATLDVDKLRAFFDASTLRGPAAAAAVGAGVSRTPAVLSVEGRVYPVQVHYLLEPCTDYVKAAVNTVVDLHREDVPGDVLVFLTGQEECQAAVGMLEEEGRKLARSRLQYKLHPVPLYAGLPGAVQRQAFEATPRGLRKVVVATNIAETSLTLEGVVYVVDSCYVKQRAYNPLLGLEGLLVAPTSKASAQQRAGRAGRVRPGHAFRLCTEEDFQELLPAASVPEMQRSDLGDMLLSLKALGVDNVMRFDWLAPPPAEAVIRGLEQLYALGALDDYGRLTRTIGLPLSALPLEPGLGRALLAAATTYICAAEMLTIAAMLSVPSFWAPAYGDRKALEAAKGAFAVAEGDLATCLNVYQAWVDHQRSQRWAQQHMLHQHSLLRVDEIRRQLAATLRRLQLPPTSSSEGDLDPVLKAAAAGLFLNAAQYDRTEYNQLRDSGRHVYRLLRHVQTGSAPLKLTIHPSSVLARVQPQLVVFRQCQQNDEGWYEMQGVSVVEQQWLTEVAPAVFEQRTLKA